MSPIWPYAAAAAAGYLAGSVPFGVLLARAKGVDLSSVGSGNIGAANVSRALGSRWGAFVLILDLLKGFIPTYCAWVYALKLGRAIGVDPVSHVWLAIGVALCAVLGHNFSLFLKFRGGKGVATSGGVFLALAPEALLAAIVVYVLTRAVFKYFSLASILAAAALPLAALCLPRLDGKDPLDPDGALPIVCFAALAGVLVIARHQANIRRLLAGTEPKHHVREKKETQGHEQ